MHYSSSRLKSALLLASALVLPQAVLAEENDAPNEDGASVETKGDILVTARKVEERVIDVPLQISVFSDEEIQNQDIRDLADIAQRTPGLEFEVFPTSGLTTAPVIRGMSQTFTTSRIQNTATFIDGVYLQRQSMVNPGLLEVERVEVVKGPQSAVYGRNAFSGSINYVTKRPDDDWSAQVGGTIGSGERYDFHASVSAPIVPGMLAVRASYAHSEFDGHTRNDHPFANSGPTTSFGTSGRLGGWDDETYSISALFTPVDSVEIGFLYYNYDSVIEAQPFYNLYGARRATVDESFGAADNQANCINTRTVNRVPTGPGTFVDIPIFGNHGYCGQIPVTPITDPDTDAAGFNSNTIMVDPRSHGSNTETQIYSAHAIWDITDEFQLKYQFAQVDHHADGFGVQAGRDSVIGGTITEPLPPFAGPQSFQYTTFQANPIIDARQISHELRLTYDTDNLSLKIGGFYSKTDDDERSIFYFPAPCDNVAICSVPLDQAPAIAPPTITVVTGPPPAPTISVPFFPIAGHGLRGNEDLFEDEVRAIFAAVKWDVTERFHIAAEARYEEEENFYQQLSTTFGRPANYSDVDEPKFFTPRVTIQYDPDWANGGHVYALVAKGVKAGGFNSVDPNVNPGQAIYGEESNWTYEVGLKGRFFNNNLQFNAAAYYIDWKDIQGVEAAESANPFAVDVTGNIGDARVYGLEMDGIFDLSDAFSVDFAFAWLDPKYKSGIYSSSRTINADGTPNPASTWGCTDLTPECEATGDISGNQLERTSTVQGSLGFNYYRDVKIITDWDMTARLGFTYRNKMYATPLNLAHNGDRLLSNANLSFSNDNFTVSFWGKNIFNKKYVANSFVLQSFNTYIVGLGAERTFGLTVKAGI